MKYQPKDSYYRRAKKEGYRSRAAYKLLELNRRFHLIKQGDRVVDLGAAPGGWMQVAARLTGSKGRVIGVDIQRIEPFKEQNILILQENIASEQCQAKIKQLLDSSADCVLSDISPRLSGIRDADVSRSAELARLAFRAACSLLKPGGNFLVKLFVSEELESVTRELKARFGSVVATRPEASRKGSSEIYLCGRGLLPDSA